MYQRRNHTFTFAGLLLAGSVFALAMIPADPDTVARVSSGTHTDTSESIAAIDAMLGASAELPEPPIQQAAIASVRTATSAVTQAPTLADTVPEEEDTIDPSLRADAIGRSAVNLRAGPSTATATITVLQPGRAVHVGEEQGGWVEVTLDDGQTGWVFSRYLASVAASTPEPEAPAANTAERSEARVADGGNRDLAGRTARVEANLVARSGPSSGSRALFRTEPGETVRIIETDGDWLRIRTVDGSQGWIRRAG